MAKEDRLDILAFGAHPDDVELSCGGTVVKMAERGFKTGIVDLTMGEMGTRGTREQRLEEAKEAASIMGVEFRENLDLGDAHFEINEPTRMKVIDRIRKYKPRIVLAPHNYVRHPDHGRAGELVTEAAYYAGLANIESQYEHYRPEAVFYYFCYYVKDHDFIIDISDAFEKKMEAIKAHRTQFFDVEEDKPETIMLQPDFLQKIETRSRYFGGICGAEHGEPFSYKGNIRVNNFFDIL